MIQFPTVFISCQNDNLLFPSDDKVGILSTLGFQYMVIIHSLRCTTHTRGRPVIFL